MDNNSEENVNPAISQEIQDHLNKFQEGLAALSKEHNIALHCEMIFPQYNILPEEVQLALKVISNHKGKYQVSYIYKSPEVKQA